MALWIAGVVAVAGASHTPVASHSSIALLSVAAKCRPVGADVATGASFDSCDVSSAVLLEGSCCSSTLLCSDCKLSATTEIRAVGADVALRIAGVAIRASHAADAWPRAVLLLCGQGVEPEGVGTEQLAWFAGAGAGASTESCDRSRASVLLCWTGPESGAAAAAPTAAASAASTATAIGADCALGTFRLRLLMSLFLARVAREDGASTVTGSGLHHQFIGAVRLPSTLMRL